jgi:hypothetical protein
MSRWSAGCKTLRSRTIHLRLLRLEDRLPEPPDPTWHEMQARFQAMTDDELKAAIARRRAQLMAELMAETKNGKPGRWI